MGKSRRNRAGAHRRDPLSKPVKPPTDPELAAVREQKILPVIKDLQSAEPSRRTAASAAVANIVHDARCRKLLLREHIVHTVLAQTLTDAALESRAAGWHILHVLANEEEPDFCVHLYRQDILTAMGFAAKMVTDKFTSKDHTYDVLPQAERALVISITYAVTSLATLLAQAQDEILLAISANASLLGLPITFISLLFNYKTRSPEGKAEREVALIMEEALECLMTLTEDNAALAETILTKENTLYNDKLLVLSEQVSGEGVLACAILHNIFVSLQGRTVEQAVADDAKIMPTLSKVIASITPGQQPAPTEEGFKWSQPLEYQDLALQIIASIGTSLHSTNAEAPAAGAKGEEIAAAEEEDEDMGDAGDEDAGEDAGGEVGEADDDEMDEDEMQADMNMVTGAGEDDDSEGIDRLPVLKSLLQQAVPEVIRVAALQDSAPGTLRLQQLALDALNNISWSTSIFDFNDEHNAAIKSAWTPVGQAIWTQVIATILSSDTADVELATRVTGLAWAVARSLRSDTPLEKDEHRKFISLYQATRGASAAQDAEDPFKGLGVKCIGVLGQLALPPAPVTLNREIGTFLITVLSALPKTPSADAVEALNQLFDIYGDEEAACDKEVFWKDSFLKHLEEVLPKAKAMLKAIDKRTQPELRSRADEAVLNLNRFLAYKRKNKPS